VTKKGISLYSVRFIEALNPKASADFSRRSLSAHRPYGSFSGAQYMELQELDLHMPQASEVNELAVTNLSFATAPVLAHPLQNVSTAHSSNESSKRVHRDVDGLVSRAQSNASADGVINDTLATTEAAASHLQLPRTDPISHDSQHSSTTTAHLQLPAEHPSTSHHVGFSDSVSASHIEVHANRVSAHVAPHAILDAPSNSTTIPVHLSSEEPSSAANSPSPMKRY
jgi:hypothetical protein